MCVWEREKGAERWGQRKREGKREELKLISYIGPASITQFPQYTAKTGTRIWKVSSYFIEPLPSVPYPNLRKNRESVHQDTPLPAYTPTTPLLPRGASMRAPTPLTRAPQLTTSVARSAACAHQYSTGRLPSQRFHWQDTICPISPQLSKTWHKLCRLLSTHRSSTIPLSCYLHPLHFHVVLCIFGSSAPSHISGVKLSLVQRSSKVLSFDSWIYRLYSARSKFYCLTLPLTGTSSCPVHVRSTSISHIFGNQPEDI